MINQILEMLKESGAHEQPHGSGRSLIDHLRGTMKVLCHWRQPENVVAAGLLHSVYSTEAYRHTLIPFTGRAKVAAVAGEEAEKFAYLFCTVRRNNLFEVLGQVEKTDWESLLVRSHQRSECQQLSKQDVGALLVLYMANEAEQAAVKGRWLSHVSQWGAWARPLVQRVPPVFHFCSEQVKAEEEKLGQEHYWEGLKKFQNSPDSETEDFLASAKHLPYVAEPLVFLAYESFLKGRWSDAFSFATSALTLFNEWGTAWDKRLALAEWETASAYIKDASERGFSEPMQATGLAQENIAAGFVSWTQTICRLSLQRCKRGCLIQ